MKLILIGVMASCLITAMEKQQDLVPLTDQFERKLSLFDSGSISDHKQPETLNSTTRLLLLEQLKQKIDQEEIFVFSVWVSLSDLTSFYRNPYIFRASMHASFYDKKHAHTQILVRKTDIPALKQDTLIKKIEQVARDHISYLENFIVEDYTACLNDPEKLKALPY